MIRNIIYSAALAAGALLLPAQSFAQENDTNPPGNQPTQTQLPTSLEETLALGLRVVEIVTVDGEEPTAEYVTAPPGSWGLGITNATKVPGSVNVYNADGTVAYASGEYVNKESGMTIKLRGNTSAYSKKKPFKIKLQKKGDMLGRGDKNLNDKNWVLIDTYDMKGYIGFKISKLIGQPWTPAAEYVNVIFNGDYRGVYYLAESIEQNEKCRIDVSDTGFVMEHDPYWWNEDGAFEASVDQPEYAYTYKFPDIDDTTEEQRAEIGAALAAYEKSVADGSYASVIDVDSFARWMLAQDIMGTKDGGGVNLYFTKYDNSPETPIICGPLWDFDSAQRTDGEWSSAHTARINGLVFNINPAFTQSYVKCWDELNERVFAGLDALAEDLKDPRWEAYDRSIRLSNIRWENNQDDVALVRQNLIEWYGTRREWMRDRVEEMRQSLSLEHTLSLGLPVVDVTTAGGLNPQCDYIRPPEGSMGQTIGNVRPAPGSLTLYNPDGSVAYTTADDPEAAPSGMELRIDGNTTAWPRKKTFRITLDEAADMTDPTQAEHAGREWQFIASPQMKTMIGLEAARLAGQPWVPSGRYVNLRVNGLLKGLYFMVEAITPGEETARHAGVEADGFVMQHDPYWWAEEGEYLISADNPRYNYTFKYPDPESLSPVELIGLQKTLADYEASVADGTYPEKIDVESFALWTIVHDLIGTSNGGGVDLFLTKRDASDESLIQAGPHWNLESSWDTPDRWSAIHSGRLAKFFNSDNKELAKAYYRKWGEIGENVLDGIDALIASIDPETMGWFDASVNADNRLWNASNPDLATVKASAQEWFARRREWMAEAAKDLDADRKLAFSLGLPIVEVVTVDGEEPTADSVDAPEGSIGTSITNATKVPGSVNIYNADGSVAYESGEYVKKESGMTIKIRGNSSARYAKKPYKIKLQKSADLLGREEGTDHSDKDWVLMDPSDLHTHIGHEIGRLVGQDWNPTGEFVNLLVNGDYRGLYWLGESIERNETARIDVGETGFIAEYDPFWWNEDYFILSQDNPRFNYSFKYPDVEDIDDAWRASTQEYFDRYERSVADGTYPEVIDVRSFAAWILAQDILGTEDDAGTNWYLTRHDNSEGTLLKCGPLWDFDSAEKTTGEWSLAHRRKFSKFFENTDDTFLRTYIDLWREVRGRVATGVDSIVNDLSDPRWRAYDASVEATNRRWGSRKPTSAELQERKRAWYAERLPWLEAQIGAMRRELGWAEVKDLGLPIMEIVTENDTEPTCVFTPSPEGSSAPSAVTDAATLRGSVTIFDATGKTLYESGEYREGVAGALVRVDGSAREESTLRPLSITLERESDLLDRGDSRHADRDWLLAEGHDLRTPLGLEVSRLAGQQWTPAGEFVNLLLNGDFKGVYYLVEPVERDRDGKIDVTADGFVAVNTPSGWNSAYAVQSQFGEEYFYIFGYPYAGDIDDAKRDAIARRLAGFENSLADGTFENHIDFGSFARWLLIHDILGSGRVDDWFITRFDDRDGSLLMCGPAWNFMTSEATPDKWSGIHLGRLKSLFSDPEAGFMQSYLDCWDAVGKRIFDGIDTKLGDIGFSDSWKGYATSVDAARLKLGEAWAPASESVARAAEWFADRRLWLTAEMEKIRETVGVRTVEAPLPSSIRIEGLTLTASESIASLTVAAIDGTLVHSGPLAAGETLRLPAPGLYLLRDATRDTKLLVK